MSFGPLAEPDYSHRVAKKVEAEILSIAGQDVKISNPSKLCFPTAGLTKLQLVHYYSRSW
jgi:hypothetical protein